MVKEPILVVVKGPILVGTKPNEVASKPREVMVKPLPSKVHSLLRLKHTTDAQFKTHNIHRQPPPFVHPCHYRSGL